MRSEWEIFNDLGNLCTSSGFVYVLAYLNIQHRCIRGNSVGISPSDMHCAKEMSKVLIETEISALVGLMIKKRIDYRKPEEDRLSEMFNQTHLLLHELHENIKRQVLSPEYIEKFKKTEDSILTTKELARERIFYASQSANDFQFLDLIHEKYKNDDRWLVDNLGFSSLDMKRILRDMWKITQKKLRYFSPLADVLKIFSFDIHEIQKESNIDSLIIRKILECFTVKEGNNADFKKIDDLNEARIRPIIQKDENTYFCFSLYALFESAYDSPFFWIKDKDKKYFEREYTTNRGKFVEVFSYKKMCEIFGKNNVYQNVVLYQGKVTVEEIDILVTYRDRILICQAKAKGLTLSAKQGQITKLKKDFKVGIQKAYDQAIMCANFLRDKDIKAKDMNGNIIEFKQEIYEIYPVCIIGNPFPSLSSLIRDFLEHHGLNNTRFPYIVDVFLLDMMAEVLESPLFFMDFLNQRTYNYQKYISENEIEVLGYYVTTGFVKCENTTHVVINADYASGLDLAFLTRRIGEEIGCDRYEINGFIDKFRGTIFEDLIYKIQSDPDFIEFGFFLLDVGSDFVQEIEKKMRELGHRVDKELCVNFCRPNYSIGVTIFPRKKSHEYLLTECRSRQMKFKMKNWVGLSVDPNSMKLYTLVMINGKWRCVTDPYNVEIKKTSIWQVGHNKAGRNDPCPCGSGKKYKKCCLK